MKKKATAKSRMMTFRFTAGRVSTDLYHGYAALAMHALLLRGANFYGAESQQAAWPKAVAEMAHTFAQAMVEQEPDISAKVTTWALAGGKKKK